MLIVFPMGGTGKRFLEKHYTVPKPLLELSGKTLIQLAVESTALLEGRRYYIAQKELFTPPYSLPLILPPNGTYLVLSAPTAGCLQTVLLAKPLLESGEELLICDCDSFMDSDELYQAVRTFRLCQAAGGVTVRKTTDPNCSFATVDPEWWVLETREKDPFTQWSTTGPYWFRSGKLFLDAAAKAVQASVTSISPVYNYLDGRTKAVPVGSFHHVGTPQELEAQRAAVIKPVASLHES